MARGRSVEQPEAPWDELAWHFEKQAQKYEGWGMAKDAARMQAYAALNRGYAGALDKFYEAYPVEPIPQDSRWYRVLIRVLEFLGGMTSVEGYTLYKDRLKDYEALNKRIASWGKR